MRARLPVCWGRGARWWGCLHVAAGFGNGEGNPGFLKVYSKEFYITGIINAQIYTTTSWQV